MQKKIIIPSSTLGKKQITFEIVDDSANIKIGNSCKIDKLHIFASKKSKIIVEDFCELSGELRCGYNSLIHICKNTTVASNLHVTAYESTSVLIGNDCMFSHNCIIRTTDGHYIYDEYGNRINKSESIVIGNHVWCAMNVTILKGVSIGEGSVIGIGSIVTHDIENNSIAVGIPAKTIKKNIVWKR